MRPEPLSAKSWGQAFAERLRVQRQWAEDLRTAALARDLAGWTANLTAVVLDTFDHLGLVAAAKGRLAGFLPVPRQEYLSLDVTAFPATGSGWRFPVAVCELENSHLDKVVAYSLWKVLCVRADLRLVFCYREERESAAQLVNYLADEVVAALPMNARKELGGETVVFTGLHASSSTFPYGFFVAKRLNIQTGRFERFPWQ